MLSKNEIRFIQALSHKKDRQQQGLFIAEGVKLVEELLLSQYKINKIYATSKWVASQASKNQPVIVVSEDELDKISTLQTPNQVLALVHIPPSETKPIAKDGLILMLDGIQDPGNFGTIVRIADWFGINQIVCSQDTVELFNPKAIQSTMGSFIRVNIAYDHLVATAKNTSLPIFGALLAGKSIYEIDKLKKGILVIGNEGKGISNTLLPFITNPITIPKIGGAESLNAGVATGIILSHLVA